MVRGESPYNTASLDPVLPAAWFPMAIGFFGPLGWLSENIALLTWYLISIIELSAIIFFSQGKYRTLQVSVMTALLAFSFPPTLYHVMLGQISLTVALCMILATQLAIKNRPWLAAFFVALGLSKPHLGLLALFGLSIYYFKQGGFREMLVFWIRAFLAIIILCLPLFFAYSNWMPDAIASMQANPYWDYPSILVVLRANLGAWGLFVWGLIVSAVLGLVYFMWKKLPTNVAIYWSLGLSLLITPYIGSWDFVVLLPIFIATFAQTDWKRKLVLILSYLLAWYGMALVQRMEPSYNYFFWWVPLWLLASVAVVTPWKKCFSTQIKAS